ncbi:MAG: hypothetical protein ACRDEB_09260 [Chitinophagaceae bacterium]
MKSGLLITTIFIQFAAIGQSPHLSLLLKMDSAKSEGVRYKIEMKICEPQKMTERSDWFTHDTSTIDFISLKSPDIRCGAYFDKGMGEPLTYNKEEIPFNKFEFSNQLFVWEKIFVFKISNWSSRGWQPEMYIVIPMKYKSFVTYIKLTDIEFQSGKVMFLSDYNASYSASQDKKHLNIDQSLKDYKTVDVKKFPLRELLEAK